MSLSHSTRPRTLNFENLSIPLPTQDPSKAQVCSTWNMNVTSCKFDPLVPRHGLLQYVLDCPPGSFLLDLPQLEYSSIQTLAPFETKILPCVFQIRPKSKHPHEQFL